MTDSMRPSRVWASWLGKGLLCLLATAVGCAEPRPGTPADDGAAEPIRLVLQITVDGLRSDLLDRYGDRFGDGGFRKLLDEGTVYRNAHYTPRIPKRSWGTQRWRRARPLPSTA